MKLALGKSTDRYLPVCISIRTTHPVVGEVARVSISRLRKLRYLLNELCLVVKSLQKKKWKISSCRHNDKCNNVLDICVPRSWRDVPSIVAIGASTLPVMVSHVVLHYTMFAGRWCTKSLFVLLHVVKFHGTSFWKKGLFRFLLAFFLISTEKSHMEHVLLEFAARAITLKEVEKRSREGKFIILRRQKWQIVKSDFQPMF